ncbi:TPA: microcin, partial [Escherichia coli]|nr:microcin [Escherichia coli]
MREISQRDLYQVLGAGSTDPNTQLLKDLANNMAWGAALGAKGGLGTAAVGAGGAAVQTVVQGLINHGP